MYILWGERTKQWSRWAGTILPDVLQNLSPWTKDATILYTNSVAVLLRRGRGAGCSRVNRIGGVEVDGQGQNTAVVSVDASLSWRTLCILQY